MTELRLRRLAADEPANWPTSLTHPATFTALDGWMQTAQRTYKYPIFRFETESASEVTGILSLSQIKHPIFGNYLTSAPFGSYGGFAFTDTPSRDMLLNEARLLAAEQGVEYVNLRWSDYGTPTEPPPPAVC